jgi:hypothetical protein
VAFLAGENITAARLNRLQPRTYWAQASSTIGASQTNVDVPSATVTFTTDAANATIVVAWPAAFYFAGAAGGLSSVSVLIDGSSSSPMFAISQQSASTDKNQGMGVWQTTLATAGSHTVKLRGTTNTNTTVQIYTALSVTVYEVV